MNRKRNWLIWISLGSNLLIILVLLMAKLLAESRLQKVSSMLNRLGESEIVYTVHIEDTLQISTAFLIEESVPVRVKMDVDYDLDFNAMIPVNQQIETPIKLVVNQNIKIDTGFLFKDKIVVPLDEIIHVDQKFLIATNSAHNKGVRLPIVADIPLKQNITLIIKDPISVYAEIPIKIPISQTIPVQITMTIPVNLKLPLHIPVNSNAVITFPQSLPVKGSIPLNLDIPVKIPLSATPIKSKADSIAFQLNHLLKL
ncbi:MAG: hypothetical protein WCQ95_14225 [Bacteroidota bacterium]